MSTSATSRLYPFQWGSGKDKFLDLTLTAYSFECVGREAESKGDKIILPQNALKDVSRMRLPFPLTFFIGKGKYAASRKKKSMYSVFSSLNRFLMFCYFSYLFFF